MNKEFIPYEQALELKELGFDEPCLGFYDGKGSTQLYFNNKRDASGDFIPFVKSERLTWFGTPTFSQAFRWFREKYRLHRHICYFEDTQVWHGDLYRLANGGLMNTPMELTGYKTYEEAEVTCLQKLIEIVKNQNNG